MDNGLGKGSEVVPKRWLIIGTIILALLVSPFIVHLVWEGLLNRELSGLLDTVPQYPNSSFHSSPQTSAFSYGLNFKDTEYQWLPFLRYDRNDYKMSRRLAIPAEQQQTEAQSYSAGRRFYEEELAKQGTWRLSFEGVVPPYGSAITFVHTRDTRRFLTVWPRVSEHILQIYGDDSPLVAPVRKPQEYKPPKPPALYLSEWGRYGLEGGEFTRPTRVAVDEQRRLVYVTDVGAPVPGVRGPRVVVLDTSGSFIREWGLAYAPAGIAVGPLGEVYIAGAHSISVYGSTGERSFRTDTGPPGEFGIAGLIVDVDRRRVYVAADNYQVHVFTTDGAFVGTLRSEVEFVSFSPAMAVDADGNVYLVDGSHGNIHVFDNTGRLIRTLSMGENFVLRPRGAAIDGKGNLYVTENAYSQVKVFDAEGKLVALWGSLGKGRGQFWLPEGIVVTRDNRVLVADTGNYRVQVLQAYGTGQ